MKISDIQNVANTTLRAIQFEQAVKMSILIEEVSNNPVLDAIQALKKMAEEENVTIAIIGGAAAAYHGYPRSTKDVDIVADSPDFQKIVRVAHKYGFHSKTNNSYNPSWMFELIYKHSASPDMYELPDGEVIPGILIEVLEEGMMDIPPVSELGVTSGLGFASLKSWVGLKLRADRMQDMADVVQVMKKTSLPIQQEIGEYLIDKGGDLYDSFEYCLKKAHKELKS